VTGSRPRRFRGERGTTLVEFSFVAPVIIATIGMAMFSAHIYEVSSGLQRAAERAARYAAVQCDPRNGAVSGGCTGGRYHTENQILAYVKGGSDGKSPLFDPIKDTVVSSKSAPGGCAAGNTPVMCLTYFPNRADSPVVNQRVKVQLLYRYDEPFAPFLRTIGFGKLLVDLTGDGESTIE
jgi:hypothetical protein